MLATVQLQFQEPPAVPEHMNTQLTEVQPGRNRDLLPDCAPGTYNVHIRDAVNPTCILTLNPALVITQPAVLNATVTKTDITCFGANNGSIIISGATGGYGTYQYTINGGTTWLGSGNFTNLIPGTYNVRIRDAVNTSCALYS